MYDIYNYYMIKKNIPLKFMCLFFAYSFKFFQNFLNSFLSSIKCLFFC
jgi:hypothetical protein